MRAGGLQRFFLLILTQKRGSSNGSGQACLGDVSVLTSHNTYLNKLRVVSTVRSIEADLRAGARAIEVDVVCRKSGKAYVSHSLFHNKMLIPGSTPLLLSQAFGCIASRAFSGGIRDPLFLFVELIKEPDCGEVADNVIAAELLTQFGDRLVQAPEGCSAAERRRFMRKLNNEPLSNFEGKVIVFTTNGSPKGKLVRLAHNDCFRNLSAKSSTLATNIKEAKSKSVNKAVRVYYSHLYRSTHDVAALIDRGVTFGAADMKFNNASVRALLSRFNKNSGSRTGIILLPRDSA